MSIISWWSIRRHSARQQIFTAIFSSPARRISGKRASSTTFEFRRAPFRTRTSMVRAREIDKSSLDVRRDELHLHPIADVAAFLTVHEFSLDRRMENADPDSFIRRAGDDRV